MTDQPVIETPAPPARVVDRGARIWLIILSVVVGVQALVITAVGVYSVVSFGGFGFLSGMPNEEAFMATDRVGREIDGLVQDRDTGGYMELYRDNDPSVDLAKAESDFEAVLASVESTEGVAEYTVDSATEYTDATTGEKIVSMTMSAYDYTTGEPRGRRISVWVLYDELPTIVLTGEEGRELGDPKMLY